MFVLVGGGDDCVIVLVGSVGWLLVGALVLWCVRWCVDRHVTVVLLGCQVAMLHVGVLQHWCVTTSFGRLARLTRVLRGSAISWMRVTTQANLILFIVAFRLRVDFGITTTILCRLFSCKTSDRRIRSGSGVIDIGTHWTT